MGFTKEEASFIFIAKNTKLKTQNISPKSKYYIAKHSWYKLTLSIGICCSQFTDPTYLFVRCSYFRRQFLQIYTINYATHIVKNENRLNQVVHVHLCTVLSKAKYEIWKSRLTFDFVYFQRALAW